MSLTKIVRITIEPKEKQDKTNKNLLKLDKNNVLRHFSFAYDECLLFDGKDRKLKGPLCLRNAIILISQILFIFVSCCSF
jgi:hypothetical protein